MEKKLTIEHLAPYLPYGLKVMRPDDKTVLELHGIAGDLLIFKEEGETYGSILGGKSKPLLLLLSEFNDSAADTEIYEVMGSYYSAHPDFCTPDELPYKVIQILLKHHFDVFGLLESGLALDKSTYKS